MQSLKQSVPAGATGAIAALLLLGAGAVGLSMPAEVAAAIVGLAVVAVSALAPRWAESRGLLVEHPTGVSTAVTTILVWAAPLAGVSLDPGQAVVLVGGVASIVGLLTPRQVA